MCAPVGEGREVCMSHALNTHNRKNAMPKRKSLPLYYGTALPPRKKKKSPEVLPGNLTAESTCYDFVLELGKMPRFLVKSPYTALHCYFARTGSPEGLPN